MVEPTPVPPGGDAPGDDGGGFFGDFWWLLALIGVVLGLAVGGGSAWFLRKPPDGPPPGPPDAPEPPGVRDESRRLAQSLGQRGLQTGAMDRAIQEAPPSAIQPLRDVLRELDGQYQASTPATDSLLRQVQNARNLCNQRIIDAVARRLPLSLLDAAERTLRNAGTDAEHRAAQQVVNGLLDAVHLQYSLGPRVR